MIELIVGAVGAGLALVIYNKFLKKYVTIKQLETEEISKEIDKKVGEIKKEQESIAEETKRKVEEIQNEQNKNPNTDDLVDFFNNRKGK